MTTFRRILTTSALAVMACGLASANSIGPLACGAGAGPGGTELGPSGTTTTAGNITCPGANLPGGFTLTSAVLTLTGDILDQTGFVSTITLVNGNAVTASGSAVTQSAFYLDGTSPSQLTNFVGITQSTSALNPFFTANAATPGYPSDIAVAPGSSQTFDVNSPLLNQSGTDTNGTDLTNWTGVTGFTFIMDTHTTITSDFGGGNDKVGQVTFVDAAATITYYYQPTGTITPEPTTMALLGGALLGIGLLGKRLRKS
jgi:PEP-CTERM motif